METYAKNRPHRTGKEDLGNKHTREKELTKGHMKNAISNVLKKNGNSQVKAKNLAQNIKDCDKFIKH